MPKFVLLRSLSWLGVLLLACQAPPQPEKSVPIATEPIGGAMGGVAADPSGVYWASTDGLKHLPPVGPISRIGLTEWVDGSSSVALDGERIFYTYAFDVCSVTKKGGAPTRYTQHEGWFPKGLAVDDDSVYWSVLGTTKGSGSRPTPARPALIRKSAKAAGPPVTLASMKHIWPVGIALDAGFVYYATVEGLFRVAKHGGEPQRLAALEGDVKSLALDEAYLYVTLASFAVGGQDLRRVKKEGGPVEVAVPNAQPRVVATDAEGLYWLTENALMLLRKGAGTPVLLDRNLRVDEAQLASTAKAVFWSDGKHLWRTPR